MSYNKDLATHDFKFYLSLIVHNYIADHKFPAGTTITMRAKFIVDEVDHDRDNLDSTYGIRENLQMTIGL